MNKKTWIMLIFAIIVVVGSYMYSAYMYPKENVEYINYGNEDYGNYNYQLAPVKDNNNIRSGTSSVKEFMVKGSSFKFSPNNLTVNKGDTVKITFKNEGGVHNLIVDGYGVGTRNLQTGEESIIQFVADKTGTFQYYCSIGNHRAMGMVGNLIVKP